MWWGRTQEGDGASEVEVLAVDGVVAGEVSGEGAVPQEGGVGDVVGGLAVGGEEAWEVSGEGAVPLEGGVGDGVGGLAVDGEVVGEVSGGRVVSVVQHLQEMWLLAFAACLLQFESVLL